MSNIHYHCCCASMISLVILLVFVFYGAPQFFCFMSQWIIFLNTVDPYGETFCANGILCCSCLLYRIFFDIFTTTSPFLCFITVYMLCCVHSCSCSTYLAANSAHYEFYWLLKSIVSTEARFLTVNVVVLALLYLWQWYFLFYPCSSKVRRIH